MTYEYTPKHVTLLENGKPIAKVSIHTENGITYIDKTFVEEAYRGRQVASGIVQETAEYIRKSGNKVQPICSYAVKWFETHKGYQDLLA